LKRNGKPTIRDVSRKANVSVATVSRVLNNQPGFSEETRRKVLQAIEELGYHPNQIARGLVSRKTRTVGVLFPVVSSMFSAALLAGIEAEANRRDYGVIVCNMGAKGDRFERVIAMMAEKRVDGLLFVSEWLGERFAEKLKSLSVPVVLVSTGSPGSPFPYVKADDFRGAFQATRYLLEAGHRRIGMVSGPPEDPIAGGPRIEGYRHALRSYGIAPSDRDIAVAAFDFHSGLRAAGELLDRSPDLTAIFAAGDEMAAGVLACCYQRGLRVPDDLSVIGYDNLALADMTSPPLTTVAQPLERMGRTAMEMLLSMLEGGGEPESLLLETSVVERKSVRIMPS